jgi:hypothetical protein
MLICFGFNQTNQGQTKTRLVLAAKTGGHLGFGSA